MRPTRFLWGPICLAAILLSGCAVLNGTFSGDPKDIVLRDRLELEWTSLATEKAVLDSGALPGDWSAGAFISSAAFSKVAQQLVGMRYLYSKSGILDQATAVIEGIDLRPETGMMLGTAKIAVTIPKVSIAAYVQVDVAAQFEGIQRDASGGSMASFRWVPLSLKDLTVRPVAERAVIESLSGFRRTLIWPSKRLWALIHGRPRQALCIEIECQQTFTYLFEVQRRTAQEELSACLLGHVNGTRL